MMLITYTKMPEISFCSGMKYIGRIPLIYMGTFCAKFLPEEWVLLYKKDARDKCMHRIWDCKCPWVKARKLYGDAPIKVYMGDGSLAQVDWQEVVTHRFVKSPIGLILPMAMPEETSTVCMTWNGYFWRRKCYEKGLEMRD